MGFQNATENMFHDFGDLVICLWKSFGKIFEVVCTNPVKHLSLGIINHNFVVA